MAKLQDDPKVQELLAKAAAKAVKEERARLKAALKEAPVSDTDKAAASAQKKIIAHVTTALKG